MSNDVNVFQFDFNLTNSVLDYWIQMNMVSLECTFWGESNDIFIFDWKQSIEKMSMMSMCFNFTNWPTLYWIVGLISNILNITFISIVLSFCENLNQIQHTNSEIKSSLKSVGLFVNNSKSIFSHPKWYPVIENQWSMIGINK
jgi:hypothetical protein